MHSNSVCMALIDRPHPGIAWYDRMNPATLIRSIRNVRVNGVFAHPDQNTKRQVPNQECQANLELFLAYDIDKTLLDCAPLVRWPSGRRRTPGKCVYGNVTRVRQNATQEHFGRESAATAIRRIKNARGNGVFAHPDRTITEAPRLVATLLQSQAFPAYDIVETLLDCAPLVRWPSGRRRTPGKCVYGNVPRVRIPPSPP